MSEYDDVYLSEEEQETLPRRVAFLEREKVELREENEKLREALVSARWHVEYSTKFQVPGAIEKLKKIDEALEQEE